MTINAFVATSERVDTGSAWGKYAYVNEGWSTQFISLDALELTACDLIKVDVDGKELDVLQSGETLIERYRPVLYFENEFETRPQTCSRSRWNKLGYASYRHPAPIFEEHNFFGNPVNHWAPNIMSLMVLGIPSERKLSDSAASSYRGTARMVAIGVALPSRALPINGTSSQSNAQQNTQRHLSAPASRRRPNRAWGAQSLSEGRELCRGNSATCAGRSSCVRAKCAPRSNNVNTAKHYSPGRLRTRPQSSLQGRTTPAEVSVFR